MNGNDGNSGDAGAPLKTIQAGIDAVDAAGTVNVRPGNYDETASDRTITQSNGGPNGPHQFGLFIGIDKSGITVQGVDSSDVPITSAASVAAHITTNATNDFGYSGTFVEGDNVTLQGLAFGANIPGQSKTVEIIGNNVTLNANDIEDYYGAVYMDDWMYDEGTQTPSVTTYTISNNIFRHGVSLDIASGPGGGTNGGPATGRVITGNTFEGDTNPEGCAGCTTNEVYWPAVSFNGAGTSVPWYVDPVGAATITGNTFGASDQYIRHRHGAPDSTVFSTWGSYWTSNSFARAAEATTDGNPANVASFSYASTSYTFPQVERIGGTIVKTHATGCAGNDCQGELAHTPINGTVLLSTGTFDEEVNVDHTVKIAGARAGVDARTRSGAESVLTSSTGHSPLTLSANDVTIDGVTVTGNTSDAIAGTGLWIAAHTHGSNVVNDILRNNITGLFLANDLSSDPTLIQHNLFMDNHNPGAATGNDIYADQFTAQGPVDGATVDANKFTNSTFEEGAWAFGVSNTSATRFAHLTFSNNAIDNHGRGAYFFSTQDSFVTGNTFTPGALNHYGVGVFSNGADSDANIAITLNNLSCSGCGGSGVQVDSPSTGITINRNNLSGLAPGISSDANVDGTCNWWGSQFGPGAGQVAGAGSVTTPPYLKSSTLTGVCASPTVLAVSAGGSHTCALLSDSTARCWGSNSYGQLGDGTITQRLLPVTVKNSTGTGPLTGITQIVAGQLHTCARLSNGTAMCWGYNSTGQLGDGTTTSRRLPVAVKNSAGTGTLSGVTQIATAAVFSCARLSNGAAMCWGDNPVGQLGDGTTTRRLRPVSVKNVAGTGPLTGVVQVSIRGIHACALVSGATAVCWGYNLGGQLGDGTSTTRYRPVVVKNSAGTGPLTGIAQITLGTQHTCARLSNGTAVCWGTNSNGQLGDGTTVTRLLPVVVSNSAGTGSLAGISQLDSGGLHTCARLTDGTAVCWGSNANGQLGDGTTTQRLRPVAVKNSAGTGSLSGVSQLAGRDVHTCARLNNGTAVCWGSNANGQLGDGTTTQRLRPVTVPIV